MAAAAYLGITLWTERVEDDWVCLFSEKEYACWGYLTYYLIFSILFYLIVMGKFIITKL